jgi:quinol monooxygenase YgiN
MSVHVIITFVARAEKLRAFREILDDVKVQLPKVAGCEAVRVFRDSGNERVFTLLETWQSEAQHRAHLATVVNTGGWDHIAAHLESPPVSSYYLEL